jgi:hypothetical protein
MIKLVLYDAKYIIYLSKNYLSKKKTVAQYHGFPSLIYVLFYFFAGSLLSITFVSMPRIRATATVLIST